MAAEVPRRKGKRILLVLYNASWHKTKRLDWHHMADYIAKGEEELNGKLFESLWALLDRSETIQSVCRTHSD